MTLCHTDVNLRKIWMRENEYGAAYVNTTINLLW